MENSSIINIEKCIDAEPNLPTNPKEVLTGSGGVSLKGDSESTFSVAKAFVSKVFKKMVQGLFHFQL